MFALHVFISIVSPFVKPCHTFGRCWLSVVVVGRQCRPTLLVIKMTTDNDVPCHAAISDLFMSYFTSYKNLL